ncbi:hypothetical protein NQ314_005475 [Rhamnusium bicolor]|uniref:Uncharacterized protein n=1 Tax=Rhamnusium bicolor TaxID=1586634 RepID=A0AAV8ZJE3_9CUCU|nr:hypothetical protein NQ314_005475 [Rhamnusium bicolor]
MASCSSPSSSLGDLDEITKNDGTSQHCSFTDLHLPTLTSEMVINLPAKNLADQLGMSSLSRDTHTIHPASWLSEVFSVTEVSGERVVNSESSAISDVNKSCDMQVNVSPSNASSVPQGNVLNISTAENGLKSNVTIQNQQNIYQKPNNLNLSSANVVGLPNHTRYASVPVSSIQNRPTGSTIFPNHVRNISEPSNQFAKYQNNNSPTQQGNVVSNHQRHSSQVDQSNLHQISHFRSSSVPKSMPIVPRHESGATTTTTTVPSVHVNNTRLSHKLTPQIHNNVSNVNVNFYRAVPVNVVSSVPTIHCLNTLSNVQGNSVSNVQVLPLGTNFQSQNNNGLQSHFPVTTINGSTAYSNLSTSCISGTTQVILHNTQANTNSIQIPSNFQNVNRNTLLSPQIVPVQLNNRNSVSTSTSTNFFSTTPAHFLKSRDYSKPPDY